MAAGDDVANGLATAVAAAVEADEPPARPVQLPLMPADCTDDLPTDIHARRAALQAPRQGPGRPAGALNKKTTGWRDYILGRYQSPLIFLAETYSRSVHDLKLEIGCSTLEALNVQQKAAAELAPYIHGKMPIEVNLQGTLPTLNLVDPSAWLAIQGIEVNQGDSLGNLRLVGQSVLDNAANVAPDQGHSDTGQLIGHQGSKPASQQEEGE